MTTASGLDDAPPSATPSPTNVPGQGGALASTFAGLRLGFRRLSARATAIVVVLSLVVSAIYALVARTRAPLDAPGRALGLVLGLVVPLSAFALVSLCVGRARLDDSVWPLASHGLPRRHLALGLVLSAVALTAALAATAALLAMVAAYGTAPGLARDAFAGAWIAAIGGAAYAAWLGLGSAFLRRGRGRWLPLLLDFTFGATSSVVAIPWPRPHLANLAGGEPLLGLSQPSSSVALAAMALAALCLAAMRAGD